MKRITILICLLFFLLILSSCSKSQETTYVGTTKNWKVQYNVVTVDNTQTRNTVLKYLGEKPIPRKIGQKNPSKITTIITYDDTIETYESGVDNKNISKANNQECDKCKPINKNEKIKAEIQWDGNSESIILRKK